MLQRVWEILAEMSVVTLLRSHPRLASQHSALQSHYTAIKVSTQRVCATTWASQAACTP